MITSPGLYTMSLEEYLSDPCGEPSLNHSLAEILLTRSPLHAKRAHPRMNPDLVRTHSDAFDLGTAVHELLLEDSERFCEIEAKDYKTKAAKQYRQDARASGQIPILSYQLQNVREMVAAIQVQVEAFPDPQPFRAGKPEQVLVWKEGGIWCRARLDWLHDDHRLIDELKTTSESAHPAAWSRNLFDRGHDLQVAFHTRGVATVLGQLPEFRFLVAELAEPYALSAIGLDPEALDFANVRMFTAIELWARCLRTGAWPSYAPRTAYAEIPPWVKTRWAERGYYQEAVTR